MRAPASALAMASVLALAACGGTNQSTTSARAARPSSSTTSTTGATPTKSTPPTTSTTTTSTTTTSTPTTSTTAPSSTVSATLTSSAAKPRTSNAGVHEQVPTIPADFTLDNGHLSPPRISAAAHTRIDVTLTVRDTHTYHVSLGTPKAVLLTARKGQPGRASLVGLANGTYAVDIDGHLRGQLIVGFIPGP